MSQKPAYWGTGMSEGLSTNGWSGMAVHSLCAWCWGASVLYIPHMGVCGVCMCIHHQTSSWTVQGALDPGRQGLMVSRGPMNVGYECATCLQRASSWASQLGTCGVGQRAGNGAGVLSSRGTVPVLGASVNV